MKRGAFFLGAMILCMAGSQVLLKFAGLSMATRDDVLRALISNPFLWGGLLASAAGLGCWLVTLRGMALSAAYPWTALIYVITPLAGTVLFDEVLGMRYIAGMAAIVTGIFITASGVGKP